MKRNKLLLLIILLLVFITSLVLINQDLYHFEHVFPFSRTFTLEDDAKGKYIITEALPLKKGTYQFSFKSSAMDKGNSVYLLDSLEDLIFSADIGPGENVSGYEIDIQNTTSVRVGISYEPESGFFEIGQLSFACDHVLYKESVLRHAVTSLLALIIFVYLCARLLVPAFPGWFRNRTGKDLVYCEKVFLFLLVLTVLCSWPLFDPYRFTEGDDFYFHLSRIEGIAKTLKAGYFPPRILLGWMGNYGVASEIYYPGLLMLFPVSLFLCGFSSIAALKIFLFFCTFCSLLTMYLSAKNIGKGRDFCGAGAALIYAFASYRLICLFYRNAVGEVQAYIFYPLIVWGLYEILRGNTSKWGIFALGFFGMLMSHLISLAISGVLCAIYLLFSIRKLVRNPDMIWAMVKAALVTVFLGAFFLLPMAEQLMKNELMINTNAIGTYENWDELWPYILNKFQNLFLYYDPWIAVDIQTQWLCPHPGWIILAVPLFRLYLLIGRKTKNDLRTADIMMGTGILLLIASTDLFPWQFFKWFLMRIQFSWRMLGPASVLLSLSGGIYLEAILSDCSRKRLFIGCVTAAALLSGLPVLIITFKDKMYPLQRLDLSDKVVHGAEYMPVTFDPAFIDINKDKINTDEELTQIIESRRRNLGFVFSFERIEAGEPVSYSVPLVYIYGYKAVLTDENGSTGPVPVSKDEMGLILVSDDGHPSGTFRIFYEKTTVQKISEVISLLTLLFLLFMVIRKKQTRSI